jgi:hypothetical protein
MLLSGIEHGPLVTFISSYLSEFTVYIGYYYVGEYDGQIGVYTGDYCLLKG